MNIKNNDPLHSESLNSIVVDYFKTNLPTFILEDQTSYGPYWGVTYSNKNIEIIVGGDIGFGINIFIDKTEFHLWQYDKTVNNAMNTNEKNILIQLDILKRFLIDL